MFILVLKRILGQSGSEIITLFTHAVVDPVDIIDQLEEQRRFNRSGDPFDVLNQSR